MTAPAAAAPADQAGDPPRARRPHLPRTLGRGVLLAAIAVTLTGVIVAPIALSSGDLMAWARAPQGLGLDGAWPWVVFGALDAAAAVCVLFVIYSAWRGEAAGVFGLLVWAFAGGSALANYRHGQATPAPDDAVFFACMSLAGPVLLHATLHRVRRWVRTSAGEYHPARAHFGLRWLPGVAFRETLQAWKAAVRSGINRPEVAIAYVRERRLLAELAAADQPGEAIGYAVGALGDAGVPLTAHTIRVWLAERGVLVDAATLSNTLRALPAAPLMAEPLTAPNRRSPSSDHAALTPPPSAEHTPAGAPARERPATTRHGRERPRQRARERSPQDSESQYAERYANVKALYLEGVTVAEQIAARLGLPSSTARRLVATVKRDLAADHDLGDLVALSAHYLTGAPKGDGGGTAGHAAEAATVSASATAASVSAASAMSDAPTSTGNGAVPR